jgi:hypothetical protein
MRVFDSNILIYHLNDVLPPAVLASVEAWMSVGAMISVMTRIAIPNATSKSIWGDYGGRAAAGLALTSRLECLCPASSPTASWRFAFAGCLWQS